MSFFSHQPGRNDACPCGSGRKFKQCCLGKPPAAAGTDRPPAADLADTYWRRYRIRLKTAADIAGIRRAGQLAVELLDRAREWIRPGLTTGELDARLHEHTVARGAKPGPLNYRGFPKSCCISVNDEICHGIPGARVLRDGDIVNVDVTPILNGYYADANYTYFAGTPGPEAQKITRVCRESLRAGLGLVSPQHTVGDLGWAIQQCAEAQGCSVVREYVGHGIGLEFHERPDVPHHGLRGHGVKLASGMVFTLEPMINLGGREMYVKEDGWTAVTRDGQLSAQFEQTLVVTESGYESLTPFDLGPPGPPMTSVG